MERRHRKGSISGTKVVDKEEYIRGRWISFFHTPLNPKSPQLDPTIMEEFPVRPVALSLEDAPTMTEMMEENRSMVNENAVKDRTPSRPN